MIIGAILAAEVAMAVAVWKLHLLFVAMSSWFEKRTASLLGGLDMRHQQEKQGLLRI
jgi:hypothetical protein